MTQRKYLTPIILFLFLVLCACSGNHDAKLKPIPPNGRILAYGGGITFGVGVKATQAYPAILSKIIHYPVINAGIPDETTNQSVRRLPQVLKKYQPSLVILTIGSNDRQQGITTSQTIKNLEKLITMIKATGADVVLLGIPDTKSGMKVPAFYQKVAKQYNIPLDNTLIADLINKHTSQSGWIALNKKDYQIIAEKIAKLLKANGAINN